MKARIKETGEIIDLAQEVIGHKGERFQWFQLELIPELYDEFFDWQSFRAEAAKDILCCMAKQRVYGEDSTISHQSELAVKYADSLIKQLKEKEEK
jgi:hypothetical protein